MLKKWYHSKTLWANVIGLSAIVVSAVLVREDIAHEILAAEASLLAIVNFILRIITDQGLSK